MLYDLQSYRLSDFILFSREVFLSLAASYNSDIWPLQIVWLLLSGVGTWLAWRPGSFGARLLILLFVAAWLWVGIVFHLRYFLTINWSAEYFGYLFLAQAVLLLVAAFRPMLIFGSPDNPTRIVGFFLLLVGMFMPLGFLLGKELDQLLLSGWGPDQTALATVGLVLLSRGSKLRFLLLALPLLWLAIAAGIWMGMPA